MVSEGGVKLWSCGWREDIGSGFNYELNPLVASLLRGRRAADTVPLHIMTGILNRSRMLAITHSL